MILQIKLIIIQIKILIKISNKYKKLINNKKLIKNEDKTHNTKNENQVEYKEYICFKENQIGQWSFGEVLYGKHKNKNLEETVKIINSERSIETIRREINYTK